jgi:glycosyltransferase involved in cell wall biosynthesis
MNTTTGLVSVIIPFLNTEEFLEEAIQSVLFQTYRNWELLLVDDGSTDKSGEIARSYAHAHPDKIKYLQHQGNSNRGVCASRNLAVAHARGELIALLDSDDVWMEGKLMNQVAIILEFPQVSMVCEASMYWQNWKNLKLSNKLVPVGVAGGRNYEPPELALQLYPLGNGAAPCPSGLLLRKEMILRQGGFEEVFARKYQVYEDQAFLTKVYLHENVYVSESCNNLYRQRPGSLMDTTAEEKKYQEVRLYFLKWLESYLNQQSNSFPGVEKKLKKAMLRYQFPGLHKVYREVKRIVGS